MGCCLIHSFADKVQHHLSDYGDLLIGQADILRLAAEFQVPVVCNPIHTQDEPADLGQADIGQAEARILEIGGHCSRHRIRIDGAVHFCRNIHRYRCRRYHSHGGPDGPLGFDVPGHFLDQLTGSRFILCRYDDDFHRTVPVPEWDDLAVAHPVHGHGPGAVVVGVAGRDGLADPEHVLVIEGRSQKEIEDEAKAAFEEISIEEHMKRYEDQGIARKEAMKLVAKDRGVTKRDIYQYLLGKESYNDF